MVQLNQVNTDSISVLSNNMFLPVYLCNGHTNGCLRLLSCPMSFPPSVARKLRWCFLNLRQHWCKMEEELQVASVALSHVASSWVVTSHCFGVSKHLQGLDCFQMAGEVKDLWQRPWWAVRGITGLDNVTPYRSQIKNEMLETMRQTWFLFP